MIHSKALKVLFVWSFVLSLTVSGAAQANEPASPQGAGEYVKILSERVAAIGALENESLPETDGSVLRDLIRVGFDLDVTSQFVLGKYWGRAKAEQRAEFRDLFANYLVNTYASHFKRFRIGTLTVIASNRIAGGDILVQTDIDRAADTANVVWRVRARDGEYRIIDVLVDGISLAMTHRSEFASIIQRGDLEKLLRIMRGEDGERSWRSRSLSLLALSASRAEWSMLAAALMFRSASPASIDADKALSDFERGYYRLSLRAWTVLANRGDAEGQYFLGQLYAQGRGAPQDFAKAALWFGESASQGYSHSQFALGYLSETGRGVSKDQSSALKWYGLAADQSLAMAHNNVGLMYEEGRGVRQDYAQAYMRYSLAISLSNLNPGTAIQNLNSLTEKMTSTQIAQAERLAREWQQKNLR